MTEVKISVILERAAKPSMVSTIMSLRIEIASVTNASQRSPIRIDMISFVGGGGWEEFRIPSSSMSSPRSESDFLI